MSSIKKCHIHITSSEKYILNWTEYFSSQQGTCLLHSCNHPLEIQPRSYLFLNPVQRYIEHSLSCQKTWSELEKEISKSSRPVYGCISYEFASRYRVEKGKNDFDPLYCLFEASIWVISVPRNNTLEISYDETYYESILSFFNKDIYLLELFLTGANPPKNKVTKESTHESITAIEFEDEKIFQSKVEKTKELIYRGDVYQLNISHRIIIDGFKNPFSVFLHLVESNPSPQSAFLVIDETKTVVSSSPERLLKRDDQTITTQPIKGTRPRGKSPEEDQSLFKELLDSAKERSELAMITDLMRNDLFHVSKPATIRIIDPFRIDQYESVFQQSTIIKSNAKENITPLQALQAVFPGGSITGCPKSRAIIRIHEIEQRLRGLYTGSIGYYLNHTQYDWNIAIRTLIFDKMENKISLSVGSGIVWDSNPKDEYQETLYKAQSLLKACGIYALS